MLVCHCHRVNDARVDAVLSAGADGLRGVVRATRAGTGCGGCLPALREICASRATAISELATCALHADEALAG